jgi:hypothetical protein
MIGEAEHCGYSEQPRNAMTEGETAQSGRRG